MHCSVTSSKRSGRDLGRVLGLTKATVVIVLLIVTPIVRAQTGKSSETNLNRLTAAVESIGQGDLSGAERLLNSVLAASPNNADALNLLGVVRAQEGKPEEAERLFRRAIELDANDLRANYQLGLVYGKLGLHSLFLAHEDKFILTPTFHVFELFLPHMDGQAVRALFSAPEIRYTRVDKPAEFWGLMGSASVNGKELTITVTNPHASETREAEIVVRGARVASGQARVLSATDVHAHNTFENPKAVEPHSEQLSPTAGALSFRFPPASVSRLSVTLS
jgi:hypothetical protein